DPSGRDIHGLQPEPPLQGALKLGVANTRRRDVDGDDALAPSLCQQARDLRDGGADQRGDLGLALLLEVVEVRHPAQQLVLLMDFGRIRPARPRRAYHGRVDSRPPVWEAYRVQRFAANSCSTPMITLPGGGPYGKTPRPRRARPHPDAPAAPRRRPRGRRRRG